MKFFPLPREVPRNAVSSRNDSVGLGIAGVSPALVGVPPTSSSAPALADQWFAMATPGSHRGRQWQRPGRSQSPFQLHGLCYGASVSLIPLTGLPWASVKRMEPFQVTVSFTTLNTSTFSPAFRVMSGTVS